VHSNVSFPLRLAPIQLCRHPESRGWTSVKPCQAHRTNDATTQICKQRLTPLRRLLAVFARQLLWASPSPAVSGSPQAHSNMIHTRAGLSSRHGLKTNMQRWDGQ